MSEIKTITVWQVLTSHGLDDSAAGFHMWSREAHYFADKEMADYFVAKYPLGSGPRGAGRKATEADAFIVGGEVFLGKPHKITVWERHGK